jgi:hypothetical protein
VGPQNMIFIFVSGVVSIGLHVDSDIARSVCFLFHAFVISLGPNLIIS